MSTRCTINFKDDYGKAKVYRHSDGYPEKPGVMYDLERFFADVQAQCEGTMYGTRFDDPYYLATKFIVWQAMESQQYSARKGEAVKPLNFGGVGVIDEDPTDIEYTYTVHTDKRDANGFPAVTCWEANCSYPGNEWSYEFHSSTDSERGIQGGSGQYHVVFEDPTYGTVSTTRHFNHPLHVKNWAAKHNVEIVSADYLGDE